MEIAFRLDRKTGKLPGQREVDETLEYIKKLGIIERYFDKAEIHIEHFNDTVAAGKIIFIKLVYYATGKIADTCELHIRLEVENGSVMGSFSIGDFVWNEKRMLEWKGICHTGPGYELLDSLGILLERAQEMGNLNPRFRYTWQNLEGYKTLIKAGLKPSGGNGS